MESQLLRKSLSLLLTVVFLLPISTPNAFAESPDLQAEVNRLSRIVEEQGGRLEIQEKHIEELQAQSRSTASQPKNSHSQSSAAKIATTKEQRQDSPVTPEVTTPAVGQRPEAAESKNIPEIASLFSAPGVLTPKGTLILEPSLQYSNSSNDRVVLFGYTIIPAITIGVIDVRSVSSDTFVGALTARYGLTNRLETELRIPYVYREDTTTTRPTNVGAEEDKVFSLDDHAIGDIEFGLRYQVNQPVSGPYYIVGMRVKSDTGQGPFELDVDPATNLRTELPTGSGFWGIQPSLTVMYPSDPVVFYGSIDYMWTIEDNIGGSIGKYDPGDIYGFNVGMGLALNDKASISFGYDHSIVGRARQNGDIPQGVSTTQVGSFFIGGAHRLGDNMSLNLSVGIGVTEYAPDVQITTSVAVSF